MSPSRLSAGPANVALGHQHDGKMMTTLASGKAEMLLWVFKGSYPDS